MTYEDDIDISSRIQMMTESDYIGRESLNVYLCRTCPKAGGNKDAHHLPPIGPF